MEQKTDIFTMHQWDFYVLEVMKYSKSISTVYLEGNGIGPNFSSKYFHFATLSRDDIWPIGTCDINTLTFDIYSREGEEGEMLSLDSVISGRSTPSDSGSCSGKRHPTLVF